MSGLVIITFLPIIAGCILALAPLPNDTVRKASLAVTLAILAISIPLMWNFGEAYRAVSPEVSEAANSPMPFVYETNVKWIETFNINFHIGVDGLSMPFVFLTAFLCPLCILASWGIGEKVRGYFALFLLLEGGAPSHHRAPGHSHGLRSVQVAAALNPRGARSSPAACARGATCRRPRAHPHRSELQIARP